METYKLAFINCCMLANRKKVPIYRRKGGGRVTILQTNLFHLNIFRNCRDRGTFLIAP